LTARKEEKSPLRRRFDKRRVLFWEEIPVTIREGKKNRGKKREEGAYYPPTRGVLCWEKGARLPEDQCRRGGRRKSTSGRKFHPKSAGGVVKKKTLRAVLNSPRSDALRREGTAEEKYQTT